MDGWVHRRHRQARALQAGDHARLPGGELHLQPGVRVDAGQGGDVAGAPEVLRQGGADKLIDQQVGEGGNGVHAAAWLGCLAMISARVVKVRRAGEAISGKSER